MTSDHEEDTNLDEDLRQRLVEGRVLPNPEATAAVGECNGIELEHYMAGLQRQLTAHIRWLTQQGTLGIPSTQSHPRVPKKPNHPRPTQRGK